MTDSEKLDKLYDYLLGNPDIESDTGAIGRIEKNVELINNRVTEICEEQKRIKDDLDDVKDKQERLLGRIFNQMPSWMQIVMLGVLYIGLVNIGFTVADIAL